MIFRSGSKGKPITPAGAARFHPDTPAIAGHGNPAFAGNGEKCHRIKRAHFGMLINFRHDVALLQVHMHRVD